MEALELNAYLQIRAFNSDLILRFLGYAPLSHTPTSARSRTKKARYWQEGANAAQAFGLGPAYICPICLTQFDKDQIDELTFDHVPPRRLNGKLLVLTCNSCNHKAGHEVDHHAINRQWLLDFLSDDIEGNLDTKTARLKFGDSALQNVALSKEGDTHIIRLLPNSNHPSAEPTLRSDLKNRVASGTGFPDLNITFTGVRHSAKRAEISWLRSGYLGAFAVLGYRYIFRECLEDVRRQIMEPSQDILSGFLHVERELKRLENGVMVADDPDGVLGVIAKWEENAVFLPLDMSAKGYLSQLHKHRCNKKQTTFNGKGYSWPKRPRYLADLNWKH